MRGGCTQQDSDNFISENSLSANMQGHRLTNQGKEEEPGFSSEQALQTMIELNPTTLSHVKLEFSSFIEPDKCSAQTGFTCVTTTRHVMVAPGQHLFVNAFRYEQKKLNYSNFIGIQQCILVVRIYTYICVRFVWWSKFWILLCVVRASLEVRSTVVSLWCHWCWCLRLGNLPVASCLN